MAVEDAVAVSANQMSDKGGSTIAIRRNGEMVSWGWNEWGQLGVEDPAWEHQNQYSPQKVIGLP